MKAVIYARYSSDSQREESVEGQIRECKEYAERQGITILNTYIDRALSAKTDNRPQFQQMIKDSAKKLFDVVLIWKLDRFARNRYDSAHYKAILRKNGVKVISAKENISDGPEGIILESMLEGMAEYYSAELSEKIHRGQKENALKGKNNGGGIPLGYVLGDDQKLHIDPLTAPLVQEIFNRYADGEILRTIVESLNARSIRTKQGKRFSVSSFNAFFKNRKYIGEYSYQDVVIPGGVPAIVDENVFNKVQERIEKNRRAPARAKAETTYLLTTKLFCGDCGAFFIGEGGTSHTGAVHHYYKCGKAKRTKVCKRKAVKKDWIENLVIHHTVSTVLVDEVIDRMAVSVMALQARENHALPLLQKQLTDTEKALENMLNAIQQGIFNKSTKQRMDELERVKEDLEIQILQEQIQKPSLTKEGVVYWISRFKDGDLNSPEYRQKLIGIFVNSVYVYSDRLILTYNFKDGTETVTLDDIKGSDLVGCPPPNSPKDEHLLFSRRLRRDGVVLRETREKRQSGHKYLAAAFFALFGCFYPEFLQNYTIQTLRA